jgi:hypothetical protein
MQIVPALVVVGLAAVLSAPAPTTPTDTAPAATVKFTNSSAGTATVRSNGTLLFSDVASGQTTDWANLNDSTVTFSMTTTVTEADSVTVTQVISEGARYTLVGNVVEGKPVLTISASETPTPAPGSLRR